MSRSDCTNGDDIAFELAGLCEKAIESDQFEVVSDKALASATTALLRLLAARAQGHRPVDLAIGNNRLSATDAVIASTAILESASIEVFELAAWQAMTNMGSSKRGNTLKPTNGEADL